MSDTSPYAAALAATAEVLALLDQRLRLNGEKEAAIQRSLERCHDERAELENERKTLTAAADLYRRYQRPAGLAATEQTTGDLHSGALPLLPTQVTSTIPGVRARVGPQRYRILATLRLWARVATYEEVIAATNLTSKRVRKQVKSDLQDGFIVASPDGIALAEKGYELLERFENYKKSHGEALPPISGPLDDDEDAASADNSEDTEGAEAGEETREPQQTEEPMT